MIAAGRRERWIERIAFRLLLLATLNALLSNGQYTGMAVWLSELYPTCMRATALAFAFNGPRFIAFLGPLLAGTMITQFQRPMNFGDRLALNASTPSLKSSDCRSRL